VPEDTPACRLCDPAEWIARAAREHPQRVFLRTPAGRALSYAALEAQTAKFAAALAQCGVLAGERVAVRTEKSVEAVVLYLACLRLGAVFVPINVAGSASEFEHLLRDSQPRLAILSPQDLETLRPVAGRAGVAHLETLGTQAEGSLAALARGVAPLQAPGRHEPQALAAIVYTSGTTGLPKGAMLTRGNLASNATVLAHAWRFTGADVLLHVLPLFHVHGLFVAINTALACASGILLLPKFDGDAVLALLPQVSVFMGVPTHYTRLLQDERLNREATARVRLFVSGSAPLLAETHREFSQRTGQRILERYGMTETLMITSNPYDGPRLPGSVGPPLAGISVRLARRQGGADADDADGIGTVEICGPNVFAGYWRDAHKTRDGFTADGWFKSGDLGQIDAAGYLTIVGRVKDLVISGGFNVYPREVEAELDAIAGVAESAVFGVPHADLGEGVTAAVVLGPGAALTEAQILECVRARLSGYKVPKRVLLLAELPRNTMGKVRKEALRATYTDLYAAR
jgi:malonyl-CoA/methylmalonyl-CoA synthetase